jgi:hypothetical protein
MLLVSAPRELFRLTEAISELTERAVAEWSMTNGESEEHKAPWATDTCEGLVGVKGFTHGNLQRSTLLWVL